jgi:DNA-binding protein H-NS
MATLEQVEARIRKLQERADVLRRQKSSKVIAAIHKMMEEHGLTLAELSDGKSAVTGHRRGRPAGSKKAVATPPQKTAKRVASKRYLNPETGATWSGFGRAPAWIVEAADRSVFLVGSKGSASTASAGTSAAKRATLAKKVAGKKAVAKKGVAKKGVAKKGVVKTASAKPAGAKKLAAVGRKMANTAAKKTPKSTAPAKKARASRKVAAAAPTAAPAASAAGSVAA